MLKSINVDECVHCNLCKNNCEFLNKYGIDIGDKERLAELSYHCFLCGKCTAVCPKGIDGREVVLNLRRDSVRENGGCGPGYGLLKWEKIDYRYRNYKHVKGKSVLFPGCNFVSFYPKTTRALVELLDEYGIGVVYDCCGKPISELGYEDKEKEIIDRLEERLKGLEIDELILLCPNCYAFLKPRLSIKVVDIYAKLKELGIKPVVEQPEKSEIELEAKPMPDSNIEAGGELSGKIFLPCPDRENKEIFASIIDFLESSDNVDKVDLDEVNDVQCCGLGGVAPVKEPKLAKKMATALSDIEDTLYTYCASCSGNFIKGGNKDVRHILTEILGIHEKPDTAKSMINRAKTKFI